jgi:hypothetical protein
MDDGRLRAFFDTLIPRQLANHHIPGAVVTTLIACGFARRCESASYQGYLCLGSCRLCQIP